MSPRVRFEPIGEEIECAPEETVLDAAFRHGYNLVYGCREGQCSACKCFLLEGDVALKRYSSFALSDSERTNGYSLMCRAMPEDDVVVELLHYDPDGYRLEHAIRDGSGTVEAVEPLTDDIFCLVLRASEEFEFTPGQYLDLWVPGDPSARRSFSMANLPGDRRVELLIKRYPGGKLSGMLGSEIVAGSPVQFTGPYGSLRIRDGERPILMIAGGSGMAPIVSLLRQLASERCARPVRFYYGARTEADLFWLDEISELGGRLADFRFTPVVERFVHEAVDEYLAEGSDDLSEPDVYMCGPPPMVEAAEAMLIDKHGLDEQRIFVDKFTTSASAADVTGAPAATDVTRAPAAAESSERDFTWYAPAGRRASLYEDVTIDTQPSVHRHLSRGWPVSFEDGRGTWNDDSTALGCRDWFAFRDPGEQWERPYYQRGSATEQQIDAAMRSAGNEGLLADFSPEWVEFLRANLQVPAYVEHGLWFALATIGRDCLSDSVATCVCLQAAMKQRSAQSIVLYAMDLERHHGPFPIEQARDTFLQDERWQPTRRYLERLAATTDWGEVLVAANLCFEPVVGTLMRREMGIRTAAANGDTVTPVLARAASQEWEWARAWTVELVRMLLADEESGAANRELIAGWQEEWSQRANEAAIGLVPVAEAIVDVEQAIARTQSYAAEVLVEAGLDGDGRAAVRPRARRERLGAVRRTPVGGAPAGRAPIGGSAVGSAPAGGAAVGSAAATSAPVTPPPSVPSGATYDFVGIVMAKSAEGDAVAAILGRRDGVEVIEQPAFWDIRAKDRLSIPYTEVSDQLGYEIDAYSIQHEMSTHYGRMITTDEALMLFSDPTEAMSYLMS
jgi:NAD(P)H-flavin reductase/ferredoxin